MSKQSDLINGTFTDSIDVTGTVVADGLTVDGDGKISGSLPRLILNETDATDLNTAFRGNSGVLKIQTVNDAANSFTSRVDIDHATGDISFYEDLGVTAKFYWDASAESLRVGADVASYGNVIVADQGGNYTGLNDEAGLLIRASTGTPGDGQHHGAISFSKSTGQAAISGVQEGSDGDVLGLAFWTHASTTGSDAAVERMRIDSSGKLLVGKTADDNTSPGLAVNGNGYTKIVRASATANVNSVLQLNRLSSDGEILVLQKDGTTVGSIGTDSGSLAIYGSGSGNAGLFFAGRIQPTDDTGVRSDNTVDLGATAFRFDDIYATNGTIQTSDRNEKQDIDVMSEAETRVAVACKGLIRKFRWIDAVAKKGDDARIHFGIIAQDLQDAFAAEGLDAGRYAMFISSTWWEADRVVPAVEATDDTEAVAEHTVTDTYDTLEEAPEGATERTRLGVRYPELLAFIIGAL